MDSISDPDPTNPTNPIPPSSIPPHLRSESEKVLHICREMDALNLNPKKFLMAFLQHPNQDIKNRRKLWGAPRGWPSTINFINAAWDLICATPAGCQHWNDYILKEAQMLALEETTGRNLGLFHSSTQINPSFFSDEAKASRDQKIRDVMSFLYTLVMSLLAGKPYEAPAPQEPSSHPNSNEDSDDDSLVSSSEDSEVDFDPPNEQPISLKAIAKKLKRHQAVATTICHMVSFASNRRRNALQLANCVVLLACGVSQRVSSYLHYLGLASSRKTALAALCKLAHHAKDQIIRESDISQQPIPFAPSSALTT